MPEPLTFTGIDTHARSGRVVLVEGDGQLAVARWHAGRWEFPSGRPLPFTPKTYRKDTPHV